MLAVALAALLEARLGLRVVLGLGGDVDRLGVVHWLLLLLLGQRLALENRRLLVTILLLLLLLRLVHWLRMVRLRLRLLVRGLVKDGLLVVEGLGVGLRLLLLVVMSHHAIGRRRGLPGALVLRRLVVA